MNSKSSRGELYVLVQAILLIALFFGPKDVFGLPDKLNQTLWLIGQILFYSGKNVYLKSYIRNVQSNFFTTPIYNPAKMLMLCSR